MPQTPIQHQNHATFDNGTNNGGIRVSRQQPFGPADFVVFETQSKSALGAGTCPALAARPPYVEIMIRPNIPFTVQSVDGPIVVDW